MHDLVVVGAGPAGAITAREVARRGRKVLLVDKATFPRLKVCGSCVNRAAVSTLERLGLGHVLKDAIPIHQAVVGYGRRSIVFPLPDPVALSREALDTRLVEAAEAAGVEFQPGVKANLGDLHPDHREVNLGGRAVSARAVVLANGLAGGHATPRAGSRIGGGVIVPRADTPSFYEPGTIYMATGRGGYSGVLVVEGGRVDVAAAFDPGFVKSCGGLGLASEALLRGVGWPSPPGWATLPWKGTPALTRQSARVGQERLFLVGDAAGYVEPFTGEGMAWAIMSAAGLAPIASRASGPRWSVEHALEWERSYRRILGSRRRICWSIAKLLRYQTLSSYSACLAKTFPLISRVIIDHINSPSPISVLNSRG